MKAYRWVKAKDRLPKTKKQVIWDDGSGENPPFYGHYKPHGKFKCIVVYDSSGEEEWYDITDDHEWLEKITVVDCPKCGSEMRVHLGYIKCKNKKCNAVYEEAN